MPPDIADQLPGFEIKETLRETRAGVWYRAFQTRIGRDVLIKAPARGDHKALEVLQREVRLLGQLSGAGFVTLFDFHAEGDWPHAVYEWPGSKSLQGRARSTKSVDVPRTLTIAASIARIVRSLHKQKYWLRCAAPEDFYFDFEGKIQLVNLESLEPHLGKKSRLRARLWCHPAASGYTGDMFLIGLHVFFLVTGKVPTPRSVFENAGRWLDEFVRVSPADSRVLRSARATLDALWQNEVDVVLADVIASLERDGEKVEEEDRFRGRWVHGAGVAAALVLGILGGVWIWPQVREALLPAPVSQPIPIVETDQEPAPLPSKLLGPTVNKAAPPAVVKTAEIPAKPPVETKNAVTKSPVVKTLEETSKVEAGSSADEPLPAETARLLALPETVEQRMGAFRRKWDATPRVVFERLVQHGELHDEGVDLARALWRDGGSPWPGRLDEVLRILFEVEEHVALAELRSELFASDEVEWQGTKFRVRYDFSTRRHLRDWVGVGEASRISLIDGRLLVLGTARFKPARWLRPVPAILLNVPPDGLDPRRPNLNVVLGPESAHETSGSAETKLPDRLLFGIGTYSRRPLLEDTEGADGVRLPATVVFSRPSVPGVDGPGHDEATRWKLLWVDEQPWRVRQRRLGEGASVELAWGDGAVKWRVGEWALSSDAEEFQAVAERWKALEETPGRGLALLLETFESTVAVEEMVLSGQIELDNLRPGARVRARERLQAVLPEGFGDLLSR